MRYDHESLLLRACKSFRELLFTNIVSWPMEPLGLYMSENRRCDLPSDRKAGDVVGPPDLQVRPTPLPLPPPICGPSIDAWFGSSWNEPGLVMILQACIERLACGCSGNLRVAFWQAQGTAWVSLHADFFRQAQRTVLLLDLHADLRRTGAGPGIFSAGFRFALNSKSARCYLRASCRQNEAC